MDPATWIYIIIMLISLYLSISNMPKPEKPKPAAFEDFEFPQFDEGTAQAVFFGDCWTEDWMVLTYGNYRTVAIKRKSGK